MSADRALLELTSADGAIGLDELVFDQRGLIPVVVQEHSTGAVLMVAWANREAVELTLVQGRAHFFSRSRQSLWLKGETSGNYLDVTSVTADCDRDTLLARARIRLARPATWGRAAASSPDPAAIELGWLSEVLEQRAGASPESSYTARLLNEGGERVAQKVGEEAVEVVIASLSGKSETVVEEASDLLYHLLVLLRAAGVDPAEIAQCLRERHQRSTSSSSSSEGRA